MSVVLVTWNSSRYIGRALESVFAQDYPAFEVVVVDNNSIDGTPELVQEKFPAATLLRLSTNSGFCTGNNIGFRQSNGDFVLSLNPDVRLEPNFLSVLVREARSDQHIGMVTGKLYSTASLGAEDLTTAGERRLLDTTGIIMGLTCSASDRGQGEVDEGQYDAERDVFAPCAAAALYSRAMLETVKHGRSEYFDEQFFAYKEDVDLGWRGRRAGWACVFAPDAIGYHVRGWKKRSRGDVPRWIRIHSRKNQYLMLFKNAPSLPVARLLVIAFYELLVLVYFTLFEPHLWQAVMKALDLWPEMARKRHASEPPAT